MTPHKGHDVLLDALATVADLSWRCTCVGSLDRDPVFAAAVQRRATRDGRVRFTGPRTGSELDRTYAAADLLVLASHAETYGMVVTEALARGVPVIATDVGGVSEALGGRGRAARPSGRPGGPRRGAAALARRRRAARAPAPGRPGAARNAARVDGDDVCRCAERPRGSGAMTATVTPEWLTLREPADAAARSAELAERLGGLAAGRA